MMTKRELFLRACRRESVDRTPVWLMRQAGRYLPSYMKLRERAGSFMTLCKAPAMAAEATLHPISELDLDVAIIFSDILLPLEAMGISLKFEEGEGPKLSPVRDEAAVEALRVPDPVGQLGFVMEAIKEAKKRLGGDVALIGFGGAPFTLACYAVEGSSSKDFSTIMTMAYREPETLKALLDKITDAMIPYLEEQIAAGADAIQLFESWGGILRPSMYRNFALKPVQRIFAALKGRGVPLIFFINGSSHLMNEMAASGADVLSIDGRNSLSRAVSETRGAFALQGNLDPTALFAPREMLKREISNILYEAPKTGHVFNLGHGVLQNTPPANIEFLVRTVRELTEREI